MGISDCKRFADYEQWLKKAHPEVEVVKLSYHLNNADALKTCDGLIMTGGDDVHPKYFGQPEEINELRHVDEQRDEFEFRLIDLALKNEIPMFGICRGLQITNVALGGSLILDIERSGGKPHTRIDERDRIHRVIVNPGSALCSIVGVGCGPVTSSHHQAAGKIGVGLMISARSADDDIVEALEWQDKTREPFLLLVQWHPERMYDYDNPFSGSLLQGFMSEIEMLASRMAPKALKIESKQRKEELGE